ncbi:MAG: hypothetical protein H6738_01180 [Alphaproteobacteria bacterium]|nr:hypothetical protein [Alphaproteobacteria bacterium]MCB9695380.1 hypothetical protein [Alphaproteobacteria bacterium]
MRWVSWLLVLAACGGSTTKDTDEADADADADTDSDTDADTDADTDSDTDTDADTDADTDTDTGHSAHTAVPPCVDPGLFVGDAGWTLGLDVTGPGEWCATFNEARTLEQEQLLKMKLIIPRGAYTLPTAAGTSPFRLPVCFETAPGSPLQPVMAGEGEVTLSRSTVQQSDYYTWQSTQPIEDGAGHVIATFQLYGSTSTPAGTPPPDIELDGVNASIYEQEPLAMSLCDLSPYCATFYSDHFVVCDPVGYDEEHHQITFTGGDVDLEFRKGGSFASTEPAVFPRATGTLDGTAFDVTDYFRLIYNPEHHHFSRDFAVIFDAPINGACGLAVRNVDPWGNPPDTRVERVNCDLSLIDTRTVLNEVFVD